MNKLIKKIPIFNGPVKAHDTESGYWKLEIEKMLNNSSNITLNDKIPMMIDHLKNEDVQEEYLFNYKERRYGK